jgi:hypothetical protein
MCDKDVAASTQRFEVSATVARKIAAAGDITDTRRSRVAEVAGPLDGLVNCAGIYATSLLNLSADE